MNPEEVVKQLKSQSTLRLFLLSSVTLGIYTAHYIKGQTAILNQALDEEHRISEGFVGMILLLAYLAVALVILTLLEEQWLLAGEVISNLLDVVWSSLVVIWAFMVRTRMNALLSVTRGQEGWFHGLWTCLFTTLYFNFKINTLNENLPGHGLPQDPVPWEGRPE